MTQRTNLTSFADFWVFLSRSLRPSPDILFDKSPSENSAPDLPSKQNQMYSSVFRDRRYFRSWQRNVARSLGDRERFVVYFPHVSRGTRDHEVKGQHNQRTTSSREKVNRKDDLSRFPVFSGAKYSCGERISHLLCPP